MKAFIILLVGVLASGTALAKDIRFKCAPKVYSCRGGGCDWQVLRTSNRYAEMRRLPDGRWHTHFQDEIDTHYLDLDIYFVNGEGFSTVASLRQGEVFSETSGGEWIDVSLRNFRMGRGYVCYDFALDGEVEQP